MGWNEKQRGVRRVRGYPPKRRIGPIIHNQSSIINPHGFTLIELLVVISVVALLLAILLPVLSRVREQAQAAACQANLRQWGVYYATYTSENEYKMPPTYSVFHPLPAVLPSEYFANRKLNKNRSVVEYADLNAYERLLLCPGTKESPAQWDVTYANGATHRPWAWQGSLSGALSPQAPISSYGQNGWMPFTYPAESEQFWVRCLVKGAAEVPVYSDARVFCGYAKDEDCPPEYADAPVPGSNWGARVYAMDRHNGGVNGLFMDWSVRKVGVKELWTLKWSPDYDTANLWTKAGGVQAEDWPKWMRGFKDY